MNILYKMKVGQDLMVDTKQQDKALQTMLDWKKSEAPEFSATLRLYVSARRFLRHVQKRRLVMMALLTTIVVQDMAWMMA
jgi:predicted transcriptional regulator